VAGEDFKLVFETITKQAIEWKDLENLTVIFFTDGCDTINSVQTLDKALADMKAKLAKIPNLTSKFLTIGFS
jgi:hypothetical protein